MIEERRKQIEKWILQNGRVTVDQLEKELGVSPMTVWRDLKELESQGKIRRVHGGAIGSADYKENESEPQFTTKQRIYSQQKELIAHYASTHFVKDGDIIILEGGTTIANMVPFLKSKRLTILTNGLDVLNLASEHVPEITLMGCGGILRETSRTFVGPEAEAYFKGFHANTFFLSATGLTLAEGLTDPNPLEIQIKRAMALNARKRVLLIDSSKIGFQSLGQTIPLDKIDDLITDQKAPQEILEQLKELGINIHIAKETVQDLSEFD